MFAPRARPAPIEPTPAKSQGRVIDRALHLIWKATNGALPRVAIVGLPAPTTAVRDALTTAGLGSLALDSRPVQRLVPVEVC